MPTSKVAIRTARLKSGWWTTTGNTGRTDTFNDYMRANRKLVDSGGKIHRLFILTQDDLQNPMLTAVLRNQCEKIGADIWRSDAATITNKAEYQITASDIPTIALH